MEVSDVITKFEVKAVSTLVAFGELVVNSTGTVEGLVNITQVMDNKSQSEGSGIVLIVVVVLHYGLVSVGVFVTIVIVQEVKELRQDGADIVRFISKVGVGFSITTIIEERVVDEVPLGLPGSTFGLDFVSEGCALNEWIVTLVVC